MIAPRKEELQALGAKAVEAGAHDHLVGALGAMRVAEAYCYDAGAANAARNMRAARADVQALVDAADRLLSVVGCGTARGCEDCDTLRAALAAVRGAK